MNGTNSSTESKPSSATPLFIIGGARSGTSLLYKTLCLHPASAWISNWVARYPGVLPLSALNRIAMKMAARQEQVWFGGGGNAYVYGTRRKLMDRLFPMPVEGDDLYQRCGVPERVENFTPELRTAAHALGTAFGRIQHFGGGDHLVSKRIGNNLRIPFLCAAFPDARFVEIVRDGRAVAYSLSHVDWWPTSTPFWTDRTPKALEALGEDPWGLCARNWLEELDAIRRGLTAVPADRLLSFRYETFVADPITLLERVASFAGLEPSSTWRGKLESLRFDDQNDRWRQAADYQGLPLVENLQRPELQRLGYVD